MGTTVLFYLALVQHDYPVEVNHGVEPVSDGDDRACGKSAVASRLCLDAGLCCIASHIHTVFGLLLGRM